MMKAPYRLVYSIEANNYYIIPSTEGDMLAIETVSREERKFRKPKETTLGLKIMQLNSLMLYTLLSLAKLESTGELRIDDEVIEDDPLESELLYDTLDFKAISKKMKEFVKDSKVSTRFTYGKTSKNKTVKTFIDQGFVTVAIEKISTMTRQIWMLKSDKFSTLTVHNLYCIGRENEDSALFLNTFVVNKDLAIAILEGMEIPLEEEGEK